MKVAGRMEVTKKHDQTIYINIYIYKLSSETKFVSTPQSKAYGIKNLAYPGDFRVSVVIYLMLRSRV